MDPASSDVSLPHSVNGSQKDNSVSNRSQSGLNNNEVRPASSRLRTESSFDSKSKLSVSGSSDGSSHKIARLIPGTRRRHRKRLEARKSRSHASSINSDSQPVVESVPIPSVKLNGDDVTSSHSSLNKSTETVNDEPTSVSGLTLPEDLSLSTKKPNRDTPSTRHRSATEPSPPESGSDERVGRPQHETTTMAVPDSRGRSSSRNNFSKIRGVFRSPHVSPTRDASASEEKTKGRVSPFKRSQSNILNKSATPSEEYLPPQNVSSLPKPDVPAQLSKRPHSLSLTESMNSMPSMDNGPPQQVSESPKAGETASLSSRASSTLPSNVVVSHSGNMISHRKARSTSSANIHSPSKLSNSMTLTPMAEEPKKTSGQGTSSGFFSSMFSAAQSAASTIGNTLGTPKPNQSATESVENTEFGPQAKAHSTVAAAEEKKGLAVDTLGKGELNFSHLGIDASSGGVIKTKDGVVFTQTQLSGQGRQNLSSHQEEIRAKLEDIRAARAVTTAYDKSADSAEVMSATASAPDALTTEPRPSAPIVSGLIEKESAGSGTPGGSVHDGESNASIKRSGSIRSRFYHSQRQRGSSNTTIGALGAAGLSAAFHATPRLTGFAVASKKRNRDFHQLFRSVPEDDYLIEDYSCALQREIILAGRIYISEGHICFSSNILGWVTTLVISFDEVIAIEKETTAMVFPNAIAIQTLHARHTFRSLLSRDATYDLMVNIWRINHPTLKSSVNGTHLDNDESAVDTTEKQDGSDDGVDSTDDDDVYDEDEDGGISHADVGSVDTEQSTSAKRSNNKPATTPTNGGNTPPPNGPVPGKTDNPVGGDSKSQFPGPMTHAPTEFTDPSGRYDKVLKDEIITGPLGQVYTLLFGPQSGTWLSKFLTQDQKLLELQFEDDEKKCLTPENKSRHYTYTKPLNAPIGPKQTKCLNWEDLDFFDLEKAVAVTLTSQTPDVPSGNVFTVKCKYLLTWAKNNSTRFLMTWAIEWTGKSWIKGPVEKGACDGQTAFGADLIKALSAEITAKSQGSPGTKSKKKRKRAMAERVEEAKTTTAIETKERAHRWGIFEPLQGIIGPIGDVLKPFLSKNIIFVMVGLLLVVAWLRSSQLQASVNFPSSSLGERIAIYEDLWAREENELWDWLEDRVGMDGLSYPTADTSRQDDSAGMKRLRNHRWLKNEKALGSRLGHEKMSEKDMANAIRITQQRLDVLQQVVEKRKGGRVSESQNAPGSDL